MIAASRLRAAVRIAVVWAALFALATLPARAQDGERHLAFRVEHQVFGDVGTVKIDIRREGPQTQVRTSIDIRATLLGLTVRRITGDCRELWREGQLVSFASAITTDRKAHAVQADFDGSRVVVQTAEGRVYAPADTQPENPWSLRFTRASTVMSPESGELSAVEVVDLGYDPSGPMAGSARARHYLIRGDVEQHLYFDASGTPVKLVYAHSTGRVTLVRAEARAGNAAPVGTATVARRE
jgi:hypothetical protein